MPIKLHLSIVALLLLLTPALAQQTPQQITRDGLVRACNALADHYEAAKEYISKLEAEGKTHAEALALERERARAALDALDLSKKETTAQVAISEKQAQQITAQAKENAELTRQLSQTKAKLSTARKMLLGAGVVAIIAVLYSGR